MKIEFCPLKIPIIMFVSAESRANKIMTFIGIIHDDIWKKVSKFPVVYV